MTGKNAYSTNKGSRQFPVFTKRRRVVFLFIISFIIQVLVFAQETTEIEEASISLKIPKFGVVEVPAYFRNEVLYLPVTDIFTFLKINNTPSPGYDSVTGFFINRQDVYIIDRVFNQIRFHEKVFELKPGDLIKTETNLYLRSDYFGSVFGLQCVFEFRSLTATLITNFELPIIREMRLELMRKNLRRLKEGIKADTTIGRSYPFFRFGMADWSVIATQQFPGKKDIWLNLSLGSIIAGGEANVSLVYNNNLPFSEKQQRYIWHYANNDHSALRQVMLGRISTTSTSSIYAPLAGVLITNTPTTYRRSFGTYTLSDYTEPGWLVELYVNNELVDYLKADASGFFTFEVPLSYGNSAILMRFYSPWGEERYKEKNISIPFNFLPPRKLEYTASFALIENRFDSRFSRAEFNYGLNRWMTFGGGVEYNSRVIPQSTMPFVTFSLSLASSLLISAEYTHGVRFKSILSYRLPWNLQLELNYLRYDEGQKAVRLNLLEERKAMISIPFRGKHFASMARLTVDQIIYPHSQTIASELLISGSFYGISANFTTYGLFYDPRYPYIYSTLSLGFTLPARFMLTPQVQYEYNTNKFVSLRVALERRMFIHGLLRMSYEHNFLVNIQNIQVGMQYDFSFAQTSISGTYGNNNTSLVQSARGSLMFDGKTHYVGANNRTSVGRGGIVIISFLDLNENGKREKNEPRVTGLTFHISGGRIEENKRDSSVRVFDLEPFTNYFIEIDQSSFENVAWQIRKPVISVAIDPNQFKLLEVPVVIMGEASGFVFLSEENGLRGLGRIIISFYRDDSTLVARTLTEADGYYSYLGLSPGSYTARIDTAQLRKIHMTCSPGVLPFTLIQLIDGDLVGGLEFVLRPIQSDTAARKRSMEENQVAPAHGNKVIPDQGQKTIPLVSPQRSDGLLKDADSSRFYIQVGVFRVQANALAAQTKLNAVIERPAVIILENGLYKLQITGFTSLETAATFLQKVIQQGFHDAFIHKNR